jgi:hypothetical protein
MAARTVKVAVPDPSAVILRKLLRSYSLQNVKMTASEHGVSARAYPASYHPLVTIRREDGIAAAGGEITLVQSRVIQEKAMEQVGFGSGKTVVEALTALKDDLEKDARTRAQA